MGPQLRREALFALGVCDSVCSVVVGRAGEEAGARDSSGRGMAGSGPGAWVGKLLWYGAQCGCGAPRWGGRGGLLAQDIRGDHDEERLASGGTWLQMNVRHPGWAEHTLPALRLPRDAIESSGGVPPSSVLQLSAVWPGAHVKPHCGPHNLRWRLQVPLLVPCYRDCDSSSPGFDGPRIRVHGTAHGWDEQSPDMPPPSDEGSGGAGGEDSAASLLQGRALHFDDAFVHEVDAPHAPGTCRWGGSPSRARGPPPLAANVHVLPDGSQGGHEDPPSDAWVNAAHVLAAGLHTLGPVSAQPEGSMPCRLRGRWGTAGQGWEGSSSRARRNLGGGALHGGASG